LADTHTFADVDAQTWAKLKELGARKHGTVYTERSATEGVATTRTPIGTIELSYRFDPDGNVITYTIGRKPMLISSGVIWDGIAQTLAAMREA
jgi:hypothetical protein